MFSLKAKHRITLALIAFAASSSDLVAQDYFWFDNGGTITPAEGTVDQLNQIVIDYSHVAGTEDGLNPSNGSGDRWITSSNGSYSVNFQDDYANHQLTLTVVDGPIVKAGDYKLSIPEGAFNVYGNAKLVCDAVSYYWTVNGSQDMGDAAQLHIVESYPAEGQTIDLPVTGLSLAFDQEVTVSHSTFDAAGRITNLTSGGYIQLNMDVDGNVLTLTKGAYSSSDFMAGQKYELELYAGHIKSAADPDITLPATTIAFSVAGDVDDSLLKVMAQIPAAGENIRNAGSVTFNKTLTKVDASKVTLVNELGHHAALSSVGLDGESGKSMIFNISPDEHLQGSTTYRLHLDAGAITAGDLVNEETDAAYWCIPVELFALTSTVAGTAVPEFCSITVIPESDYVDYNEAFDLNSIVVTGVGSNSDHVYANFLEITITNNKTITIDFDHTITPEVLDEGGALYNSIKVVIPEGAFCDQAGRLSKHTELIIYIIGEKEVGTATWNFSPAAGSHLERLGTPWYGEDENGSPLTYYNIAVEVTGQDVWVRIIDGTRLYIRDVEADTVAFQFERNSVVGFDNRYSFEMGHHCITADGVYELVIPAEAIFMYSDQGCLTSPVHPYEAVTARWVVGHPESIEQVINDTATESQQSFDLYGHPQQQPKGLHVVQGSVRYQ